MDGDQKSQGVVPSPHIYLNQTFVGPKAFKWRGLIQKNIASDQIDSEVQFISSLSNASYFVMVKLFLCGSNLVHGQIVMSMLKGVLSLSDKTYGSKANVEVVLNPCGNIM